MKKMDWRNKKFINRGGGMLYKGVGGLKLLPHY